MIGLLQIRDAVALAGMVELQQLSRQLDTSPTLLEAMLERLAALGKVEKLPEAAKSGCHGCLGCVAVRVDCPRHCYYRCVH